MPLWGAKRAKSGDRYIPNVSNMPPPPQARTSLAFS